MVAAVQGDAVLDGHRLDQGQVFAGVHLDGADPAAHLVHLVQDGAGSLDAAHEFNHRVGREATGDPALPEPVLPLLQGFAFGNSGGFTLLHGLFHTLLLGFEEALRFPGPVVGFIPCGKGSCGGHEARLGAAQLGGRGVNVDAQGQGCLDEEAQRLLHGCRRLAGLPGQRAGQEIGDRRGSGAAAGQ